MAVYMIKATGILGDKSKAHGTAQYYVGSCKDSRLLKRIAEHNTGRGAKITRAAVEKGFVWELVMLIPTGTRKLERRIKNQHAHERVLARYFRGTFTIRDEELGELDPNVHSTLCENHEVFNNIVNKEILARVV